MFTATRNWCSMDVHVRLATVIDGGNPERLPSWAFAATEANELVRTVIKIVTTYTRQ